MHGASIRVRLTLAYTLVTAVLLCLWSWGLYRVASARLYAQLDALLVDHSATVRPLFNVAQGEVKWLFEKQELESTSYRVAHAIFDDSGHLLDSSGLAKVLGVPYTDAAQRALQTRTPTWETIGLPDRHRLRVLDSVITGSDGRAYLFRVAALQDQTEEDLRQLALALTLLVPLVLSISAMAGWWMAGVTLQPVAEITKAVQRITSTRLAERLPIRQTGDELDQLSVTLNAMIARLEASFEQMSQFLSNVSHELRTPLAALRGSCEMALRADPSAEGYQKVLAANIEELDRLARTVSDLLSLARAEAGQVPLDRKFENLSELIRDSVESMRPLADQQGVTLACNIDGDKTAEVDAQYLLRLLLNLIDNAIKYNRPHGAVEVTLREADLGFEIAVRDTGRGIPEDELPYIFDRFFRGRSQGAVRAGGAGLGLGMAHWVATSHGGSIAVDSQLGQGTGFKVWLPQKAPTEVEGGVSPNFSQLKRALAENEATLISVDRNQSQAKLSNSERRSTTMHKLVVRWSYWIGLGCGSASLVWRGLFTLGLPPRIEFANSAIGYHAFLNAAVLFLLLATAAQSYLAVTAEETKAQ